MPTPVLLLPGWQNSGPLHWQSQWEALYGYERVQQHEWDRPLRGDWITRLEDVLQSRGQPSILVAHSLGSQLVAAWASLSQNTRLVKAALLVAPADTESAALRQVLKSWAPVAMQKLPFRTIVAGSSNDPYCSVERTQVFVKAWGAAFFDAGPVGHINAESGLGAWPQGHALLEQLHIEK